MNIEFTLFDLNTTMNIILELLRTHKNEYSHQIGPNYPKYIYILGRDERDEFGIWRSELTVHKDDGQESIVSFIIDEECGIVVIFSAEIYTFEKSPLNVLLTDMAPLFEAVNEKSLLDDMLTIVSEEG